MKVLYTYLHHILTKICFLGNLWPIHRSSNGIMLGHTNVVIASAFIHHKSDVVSLVFLSSKVL